MSAFAGGLGRSGRLLVSHMSQLFWIQHDRQSQELGKLLHCTPSARNFPLLALLFSGNYFSIQSDRDIYYFFKKKKYEPLSTFML